MARERNLFAVYEKPNSYDRRLVAIVAQGKTKITEADIKAIRCLREDRDAMIELTERFARLRKLQREVAGYEKRGVSMAQGLGEAIHSMRQLERDIDLEIERAVERLGL